MLLWMKLKNLALVAGAEIEFAPGYNVISGETGAGKSIIMGALSLLLGTRAEKSIIRAGTGKCEISAAFQLPDYAFPRICTILENAGIEPDSGDDEEDGRSLLLRRVITQTSSRNFINSQPVTLPLLRELGKLLIDMHAANENQSLLHASEQLRALDRFANLASLLEKTRLAWDSLKQIREEQSSFLETLPSPEETARMRKDAEEIEHAAPGEDEDQALASRHFLAASARSILEIASRVSSALTERENSLFDQAAGIRRDLAELEKYDPARAETFLAAMESAADAIARLSSDLIRYASDIDLDETEFTAMEERMRVLQTLKRRYGPTLADVKRHLETLREKIDTFDNVESTRKELQLKLENAEKTFQNTCSELSAAREKAAGLLMKLLRTETEKLGFEQAKFQWKITPAEPGPSGADRLQILFSANPGVPVRPLKDIASSGEIARVMLALKTVLAGADEIPVLVFDEIDANIGGETAGRVGREIAKLAGKKQVICISHLPQVVRFADRHFRVSKTSADGGTLSRIEVLDGSGRLKELVRMLGGDQGALEHAKALLKHTEKDQSPEA